MSLTLKDYLTIGPTPSGEDCQQVPYEDRALAKAECLAFANQLRRVFGTEPDGAEIAVISQRHEFGSYLEVAVFYNTNVKEGVDYAFNIEAKTPELWDDEAKQELGRQP